MSQNGNTSTSFAGAIYIEELPVLVQWINEKLQTFSDKDWNYSRLKLSVIDVNASQCPYLLGCELIEIAGRKGERELKDVQNEVTWGDHHSSELGILEIISLRVNKALLATVGNRFYVGAQMSGQFHPVVRLVKRQELLAANVPKAIWYEVQEVGGEEFENR